MFYFEIKLAPISETHRTLENMGASSINFYPTGSRFIGGHNSKSDWDFYIAAMDKEKFLGEFPKFELMSHPVEISQYCGDPTIHSVYKYADIHVQIIGNLYIERKTLVNSWFRNNYPILSVLGLTDKHMRNAVWRKLMNTDVPIK